MNDDGQALYKNICANPDDDTIRLIYADWCDENGQEERARYIRLSISLQFPPDEANFTAVAQWSERRNECKRLVMTHGNLWIPVKVCPMCNGVSSRELCSGCFGVGHLYKSRAWGWQPRTIEYERGFVVSVRCYLNEIFPKLEIIRDRTDIGVSSVGMSQWAALIVQTTPITKFCISGHTSLFFPSGSRRINRSSRGIEPVGVFRWRRYSGVLTDNRGVLPTWLFDLLWKESDTSKREIYQLVIGENVPYLQYDAEHDANDALAMCIGREVRRRVYKNDKT